MYSIFSLKSISPVLQTYAHGIHVRRTADFAIRLPSIQSKCISAGVKGTQDLTRLNVIYEFPFRRGYYFGITFEFDGLKHIYFHIVEMGSGISFTTLFVFSPYTFGFCFQVVFDDKSHDTQCIWNTYQNIMFEWK